MIVDYRRQGKSEKVLFSPKLPEIGKRRIDPFFVNLKRLIKFVNKLVIFDDVGWRNGSSMIEEHDSFEIDIKLVIVNDDDVEQDSGEIE
jgi:hypothetical protein